MEAIKEDGFFQSRVANWLIECFGQEEAQNVDQRNFRLAEEVVELLQACGMKRDDVFTVVGYVYSRPVGERDQELGGVIIALCCLAYSQGLDIEKEGEKELERIWKLIDTIKKRHNNKPAFVRANPDACPIDQHDWKDYPFSSKMGTAWCPKCRHTKDLKTKNITAPSRGNRELQEELEIAKNHRSFSELCLHELLSTKRTGQLSKDAISISNLQEKLKECLDKGDYIGVANYSSILHFCLNNPKP